MPGDETTSTLRVLGVVGAAAVIVSTFVAWYHFDVVIHAGRLEQRFAVPVNLWDFNTVAALLLLAGAAAVAVLLNLPSAWMPREAALAAAAIGLAMAIYALVRVIAVPDLGVIPVGLAPTDVVPRTATHRDGGPFLALAGALTVTGCAVGAAVRSPRRVRIAD
jgi:hypothetical protein